MTDLPRPRYTSIPGLDQIVAAQEEWDRSDGRAGRQADFSGAKLQNADFQRVSLSFVSFRQADLRGANLAGTYLVCPDFTNADLRTADLTGAHLPGANLTGANLGGACLYRTDLSGANLDDTRGGPVSLSEILSLNRERTFEMLQYATTDRAAFFQVFGTDLDHVVQLLGEGRTGFFQDLKKNGRKGALSSLEFLNRVVPESVAFSIGAEPPGTLSIGVDLREADLTKARILRSDLSKALLCGVNLTNAELVDVDLTATSLENANFTGTHLTSAILVRANLTNARFIGTQLTKVTLKGSRVYGASVWGVGIDRDSNQERLTITAPDAPAIEVDDIEVAQFVYLLLNRQNLRRVIDAITSKMVLVLGRFTPDRKPVLDGIADELRKYNLLPIIFDFERSENRDFTETIKILAGMSLFVIADITNPRSAPLELQATVPDYQIPFVPIIQDNEEPFSMFRDLKSKYDWVMQPVKYPSFAVLQRVFKEAILDRAWQKRKELERRKTSEVEALSADDFLRQRID